MTNNSSSNAKHSSVQKSVGKMCTSGTGEDGGVGVMGWDRLGLTSGFSLCLMTIIR